MKVEEEMWIGGKCISEWLVRWLDFPYFNRDSYPNVLPVSHVLRSPQQNTIMVLSYNREYFKIGDFFYFAVLYICLDL